MQPHKKIAFIDIETTGLDIVNDRIIELGIFYLLSDGKTESYSQRFNPGIPIPESSTKIHGITDEDVKACPALIEHALIIKTSLAGCDICGFNSNFFDVPFMVEQFLRVGVKIFDANTCFIDAGNIFKRKEERTLIAAVKYYLGEDHSNAHNALADAKATYMVFSQQLLKYPELTNLTVAELDRFSNYDNNRVDFAGKLIRNEIGEVCFNFGKSKGMPVIDDPGFAEWMLGKDFTIDTKNWIEEILYGISGEDKKEDDLFNEEPF